MHSQIFSASITVNAYSRESTITVSLLLKEEGMGVCTAHYLFRIFIL